MPPTPVAVVAADCLLPGGQTLDAFWDTIAHARAHIVDLPDTIVDAAFEFDPTGANKSATVNRTGGWFPPPDMNLLALGVPPRTARATDRSQLDLLHLAQRLMTGAGYGRGGRALDAGRARLAIGCAPMGPLLGTIDGHLQGKRLVEAMRRSPELAFLPDDARAKVLAAMEEELARQHPSITGDATVGYSPSTGVGRLANRLDFRGGYVAIITACASSLMAVLEGCRWLRQGEADVVLAGGVDYSMTTSGLIMFSAAQAVSPDRCLPFDDRANGTVLGVGCGLVLLKRLEDARRDGDPLLAIVRGGAISSDGRGESLTQPSRDGIARMIENTLEDAAIPLTSIQYLETHGTGTPLGDAAELDAWSAALDRHGAPKAGLTIGAVKQLVGHSRSAAGVTSFLKAILALGRRTLPAMTHIDRPRAPLRRDAGSLHFVSAAREWGAAQPRRAMVAALGFGGINCGVVVDEGDPQDGGA